MKLIITIPDGHAKKQIEDEDENYLKFCEYLTTRIIDICDDNNVVITTSEEWPE